MGVLELEKIRAQVRLEKAELKIYDAHDYPKSYSSIGQALSEIRQCQLWKVAGFNSWGENCLTRFDYTERRVDELIESDMAQKQFAKEREKER